MKNHFIGLVIGVLKHFVDASFFVGLNPDFLWIWYLYINVYLILIGQLLKEKTNYVFHSKTYGDETLGFVVSYRLFM